MATCRVWARHTTCLRVILLELVLYHRQVLLSAVARCHKLYVVRLEAVVVLLALPQPASKGS